MIINYDVEQLTYLIKNIHELTGISISILDSDYNVLTNCSRENDFCCLLQKSKSNQKKCQNCDESILSKCARTKRLESHICHIGLYDAAMPIIKNNVILGYVLMGRIRSDNSPKQIIHHTENNKSSNRLNLLYQELPILRESQLVALYNIFPSILFDEVIHIIYDEFINEVIDYIESDLKESLNVTMLSKRFNVSVNYLYNSFHKYLNCTVNQYITMQRIEKAKELLTETNHTVYSIAETVGIDNYTYFCRLFKKINNLSPSEYRKLNSKKI